MGCVTVSAKEGGARRSNAFSFPPLHLCAPHPPYRQTHRHRHTHTHTQTHERKSGNEKTSFPSRFNACDILYKLHEQDPPPKPPPFFLPSPAPNGIPDISPCFLLPNTNYIEASSTLKSFGKKKKGENQNKKKKKKYMVLRQSATVNSTFG